MQSIWHKPKLTIALLSTAAILTASLLLPSGCKTSAPQPPPLRRVQIIPVGVHTNVYIAPAKGASYGVVTDNLGLLYMMGLLPAGAPGCPACTNCAAAAAGNARPWIGPLLRPEGDPVPQPGWGAPTNIAPRVAP
jgi:hypothetical protein